MKLKGLPLQPTLVSVVVVLILAGSVGVGGLAYLRSYAIVEDLWARLATELAARTTRRTLRYLEPAVPYLDATVRLAEAGRFDPEAPEELLEVLAAGLEANGRFTWVSHAGEDGTYVAVHRLPGGAVVGSVRRQLGAEAGSEPETSMADYLREGRAFRLASEARGAYDPRLRPWYRAGRESPEGRWVEPFLFATVGQPGFMYVRQDRRQGRVRGVWAVEYEVSYLSEFLSTLRVGSSGRVYVVTRDGLVVGHPAGQVTAEVDGETAIARAGDHPDPMLRGAWAEAERRGIGAARFAFDRYLAMVEPFPAASGIDWLVLIVAPEEDFFGGVRDQAKSAVLVGGLAAFLAVLVGFFFSSRISGALQGIAEEMGRVGRFELSDRSLADEAFFVREVNVMRAATDSMKKSLRSFGKYVPADLVRELIRKGEEAVLGGRKVELTTLFADVAGFTSTAEKMDPADLVPVLGELLESVSEAVRDQGGTVDKFIGDAVMAFWGAPGPEPLHARRACLAALEVHRRLEVLRRRWQAEGKPQFSMRVGVNTGECVVGNIGAPERMNYTAIGDAVNLASRLEGLNKAYGTGILVGEATVREVGDGFLLRPVDWVAVQGKERAELIHEVLCEAAEAKEATRAAVALYREALELYRAGDFEAAARAFDRAREGFGGADGPSEVMAARARAHAESPPPGEWDGVYRASK